MQVKQYIFQSPYANQVQIGRLDASSVKEDENTNKSNTKDIVDISSKQTQNSIETKQMSNILKSSLDLYA